MAAICSGCRVLLVGSAGIRMELVPGIKRTDEIIRREIRTTMEGRQISAAEIIEAISHGLYLFRGTVGTIRCVRWLWV